MAGYARKGSKVSLGSGLVCGGLLIGSGVLISDENQYEGHMIAAGTSGLMTVGMGQRFMHTSKFMPAGIVAVLAATSMAYHTKKMMEWA